MSLRAIDAGRLRQVGRLGEDLKAFIQDEYTLP